MGKRKRTAEVSLLCFRFVLKKRQVEQRQLYRLLVLLLRAAMEETRQRTFSGQIPFARSCCCCCNTSRSGIFGFFSTYNFTFFLLLLSRWRTPRETPLYTIKFNQNNTGTGLFHVRACCILHYNQCSSNWKKYTRRVDTLLSKYSSRFPISPPKHKKGKWIGRGVR